MFRNKDFDGEFDYVPRRDYDEKGNRKYKDVFSADWVWLHAVCVFLKFELIFIY